MGQYVAFRINEKPYCFLDENIKENNWKYARLIDAEYFKKAAIHFKKLFEENKNDKFVLYLLQMQNMHSLETLLALICSVLQASDFYYGWLLSYSNKQLNKVIKKINRGAPVFNKYEIKNVTWDKIVNKIFRDNEGVWTDDLRRLLSLSLEKVAHLYLEAIESGSYNSIKHGFRANLNAISDMIFGHGDEKIDLKGSKYGFEYGIAKNLNNSNILLIDKRTANWNPEDAIKCIDFTGIMIHNIKEYISIVNYSGKKGIEMIIPTKKFLEEFISLEDFNIRELTTPQQEILNFNIISEEKIEKMLEKYDQSSGLINKK